MRCKRFLWFFLSIYTSDIFSQTIISDTITEITPTKLNESNVLIYIDPLKLSDKDEFKVLSALSMLSVDKSALDTVRVISKQSLFTIFKSNYNLVIRDRFNFDNSLQNVVKNLNKLSSDYKIFAGKSLAIPLLPKQPDIKSTSKTVQLIDIYNNQKTIAITELLSYKGEVISAPNQSSENSALWAYNLTTEDFMKFKTLISDETFKNLYGKALIQVREPVFSEISFPINIDTVEILSSSLSLNTALINTIKNIDPKYFSKYYVLDFFNQDKCAHGDKVLDVIKSRLKEFQIDNIDTNIVPVPINYFDNEQSAMKFLESYYNVDLNRNPELRLWKINGDATIKSLKNLKVRNLKKCPTCIPEVYLNACLKYYYNKKPDIISTSFFVSTYDSDLMPKFFNSSPTNLITAALNEPGKKIEDLFNREPNVDGSPLSSIEPLSSLFLNYTSCGGIIVGNKVDKGKYYGMYSLNGDRVSILGKGIGWGNATSCIKAIDKGASFATPDVGVELYIAKAYWRSKSLKVNPNEARKRLLLCVDIEPEFIGQFASGGTSNMNKLLTSDDGFAEDTAGNLSPIKITDGSFISYNGNNQISFSNNIEGISGLTFIGDQAFIFFNSSIKWKEISLNGVHISIIANNDSTVYKDIANLKREFKQLIFFK